MNIDTPPPLLGLIVPPAHGRVPDDGARLYGGRVRFTARGLGIASISRHSFAPVMNAITEHALRLRDAGARAVSLMGTSISFQNGAAFTDDLRDSMMQATRLPCTTMSHAIVRAMQRLGMQRVAVGTSYIDDLNQRLRAFLHAHGFEVTALRGLGLTDVDAVARVTPDVLRSLGEAVDAAGPADGVLISCGGLQTLDALPALEARLQRPVVASSPAGFWDLLVCAELNPASPGHGRLFDAHRA